MEIKISKLLELLSLLNKAFNKKATLKVIKYLWVGEGKAIATDLETMVITALPESKEPMLLPPWDLNDVLRYIPDGTVKLETVDKALKITWNGGEASYPVEDVREFPILPEMEITSQGSLNGDLLIPAIGAALPYAATDDTRPVLTGVTLTLGNPVEVAAGDGTRMSHQLMVMSFPSEERVIIPGHSAAILGYIFAKTPRTASTTADSLISALTAHKQVYISFLKSKQGTIKVKFDFGQTSVIINPVDGSAPNFLALIPKEQPVMQCQVFAPQLRAAVNRVKSIAKDGAGIVRMEFADGKLAISANGEDKKVKFSIDVVHTEGEPNRTAINYPYLLDLLAGDKGLITISKYTDTGPVVFEYGSPQRILIMPMNVSWGDEKPAAPEEAAPADEATQEETTGEKMNTEGEQKETVSAIQPTGEAAAEKLEPAAAAVSQTSTPPVKTARRTRRKKESE